MDEPRPASPTLTNPDMILPNGDYPRRSTPSPPPKTLYLPASPNWTQGQSPVTPREEVGEFEPEETTDQIEPRSSTTTLTGIGESASSQTANMKGKTRQGATSPVMAPSATPAKIAIHGRTDSLKLPEPDVSKRFSNGSFSVLSDISGFGEYEDLEDIGSMDGDSAIHEDESNASNDKESKMRLPPSNSGHLQATEDTSREDAIDDDPNSHAAMSRRAERILANAKKRLGNMEGNLNRARHSLIISPSSSMSYRRDNPHTPQSPTPFASQYNDTQVHPALGLPPAKHRQLRSSPSSSENRGHNRVFSESSVPSSLNTSPPSHPGRRPGIDGPRAASALGAPSAETQTSTLSLPIPPAIRSSKSHESVRQPLSGGRPFISYSGSHSRTPSSRQPAGLQPLFEDEASPQTVDSHKSLSHSISPLPNEPTFDKASSNNGLTRSRSTMQMRDLQDHMQDLKGRISTLKERARTDRLTRRSLQSLRTPSPFTAAEMWYLGSGASQDQTWNGLGLGPYKVDEAEKIITNGSHKTGKPITDNGAHKISRDDTRYEYEGRVETSNPFTTKTDESLSSKHHVSDHLDPLDNGSVDGEEAYHDTSPLPLRERHEDRADAFDYENLFLHSGMGDYTQPQLGRRRSASHDSSDSAETTRGLGTAPSGEESRFTTLEVQSEPKPNEFAPQARHQRNNSVDTVSTMATFATATEGRNSMENSEDDEWDHYQRLQSMHVPGAFFSGQSTRNNGGHHRPARIDSPSIATREPDLTPKATRQGYPISVATTSSFSDTCSSDSSQTTTRSCSTNRGSKHVRQTTSHHPMSDLVSLLTAPSQTTPALQLFEEDRDLVKSLIESIRKVCIHLPTEGDQASKYEGLTWRRRLDEARRVLDGELHKSLIF